MDESHKEKKSVLSEDDEEGEGEGAREGDGEGDGDGEGEGGRTGAEAALGATCMTASVGAE